MRSLSLIALYLAIAAEAEVLWKPNDIVFELKQAHPALKKGLILEINQSLAPGESGWKQARIDVPESWVKAQIEMRDGTIFINVGGGEYFVNAANKGRLSFEILDGGKKSDQRLLEIWRKHAGKT